MNFWDKHMETDDYAAVYMHSYNEGPGCETRYLIGSFINDGESVLDMGCGPGWNYDHFKEYGPEVTYRGKDYSERFVRVAKLRRPEADFIFGDLRDFKEPDNSFDVVILQDVLEHAPGYEIPITEALRVAKKRVIITFWRGFMKSDYPDRGEHVIRDDGDDGWTAEYSRKIWEEYLDSLGYMWMSEETSPKANRWHLAYIIDKEEPK